MGKYTNGYRSIFVEKPPRLKCEYVKAEKAYISVHTVCSARTYQLSAAGFGA